MPGLVPGIHVLKSAEDVGGWYKPSHGAEGIESEDVAD
jgi:hypothetical protein